LRQLSCDLKLTANAITDAWIAAAVRAIGGHLVTFDRDFAGKNGALIAGWQGRRSAVAQYFNRK
jgi:predicted nucleic acid-binding protein